MSGRVLSEEAIDHRPRDELRRLGEASRWQVRYVGATVVLDLVLLCAAVTLADAVTWRRLGELAPITAATPVVWILVNTLFHCYDRRFIGVGSEEYRRVVKAAVALVATVVLSFFAVGIEISRVFVGISATSGLMLVLLGRHLARAALHHTRRRGRRTQRVLAVGDGVALSRLVTHLNSDVRHGLVVVGICSPATAIPRPRVGGVEWLGDVADVGAVTALAAIDVVAVASGASVDQDTLRRLAWDLEQSDVELMVAPNLVDVAGPRIHIRPVSGLSLLHVEQPHFSGTARAVKAVFDRVSAGLMLILSAPLLLAIAVAIRVTSSGPALFRQQRIGRDGREFTMVKFRTMCQGAERQCVERSLVDDIDRGPLFKRRDDPRVTSVGRLLRRSSLDELPQLVNILTGSMSLVGPRPALPDEVAQYGGDMRRRLLIKPGLTGLWQVSGRSDLTWEESVRLDLRYVENWGLTLDLFILARTAVALVTGAGAY